MAELAVAEGQAPRKQQQRSVQTQKKLLDAALEALQRTLHYICFDVRDTQEPASVLYKIENVASISWKATRARFP